MLYVGKGKYQPLPDIVIKTHPLPIYLTDTYKILAITGIIDYIVGKGVRVRLYTISHFPTIFS